MPTRFSASQPNNSASIISSTNSATDIHYLEQLALLDQGLSGVMQLPSSNRRTHVGNAALDELRSRRDSARVRPLIPRDAFQFPTLTIRQSLGNWVRSGPSHETQNRQEAAERIINALNQDKTQLDLENLNLSSLPPVLTSMVALKEMSLINNRLTILPDLPPYLSALDVSANRLASLPALPETLECLFADLNRLAVLPALPEKIIFLCATGNRLTCLPQLPSNLRWLLVTSNRLEHLPAIPATVHKLSVAHNQLICLPPLTGRLYVLEVGHNRLSHLPPDLESVVTGAIFEGSGNVWDSDAVARFPHLVHSSYQYTGAAMSDAVLQLAPLSTATEPFDSSVYSALEPSTQAVSVMAALSIAIKSKNSLEKILKHWIKNAPENEYPSRQKAAEHIAYARKFGANELDLSDLGLTTLPSCLEKLKWLTHLNVADNGLTVLPPLPEKLDRLDARNNWLQSLPPLPAQLRQINACWNQLTVLPKLPQTLMSLTVTQNHLTALPTLPDRINDIVVEGNYLRCLPTLPVDLERLSVGYNQLTDLPPLPSKLGAVFVSHNHLFSLPPLPDALYQLDASNNNIVELPKGFGKHVNVCMLLLVDNPLNDDAIKRLRCLPDTVITGFAPQATIVSGVHPDAQTMRQAMELWQLQGEQVSDSQIERWDAISHEDHALLFANFLVRLVDTAEYKIPAYQPELKARINKLLQALVDDHGLRKLCFTIADDAAATCGDRVALALNDMELAKIDHDAERGVCDTDELYTIGLQMFRLSEVEKIADEKYKAAQNPCLPTDEIEVRLAFHTLLMERLQLPPLANTMLSRGAANISSAELNSAEARVEMRLNSQAPLLFLAGWQPWQHAMARKHNVQFQSLQKIIDDKRDSLSIKPDDLTEQGWLDALTQLSRDERYARVNLTARLTSEFQSST